MEDGLISKPIAEVMEQDFLNYSMSVITDRALPDIRDGLKPVHRRILYAMHEAGNDHTKAYRKSARTVGDVIGKYHPHGDSSVYNAAVRMAQPFSMNHVLIDGQGNFGSVDGDNPAAMRYTEMRLSKIASEMFGDLHKESINWHPNYDGSETEPEVLTTSYPNILVNGGEGIAVGMASSIPPHNLSHTIDATLLLMSNPEASTQEIVSIMQAPDFPTGAIVHGLDGFANAVEYGHGKVKIRSKWHEEERSRGLSMLVIDEIPYQVNKSSLVSGIARLVRDKVPAVEGIVGLRDASSKEGIRIEIDIRKGESPEAVFMALCSEGIGVEESYSYNCVVLDMGVPRQLGLKDILLKWINFRHKVILARHVFDRKNALSRLHIMEGYMKAIAVMDEVIRTIRSAKDSAEAKTGLMELIGTDDIQTEAILAMRLQKLTGMELDGIRAEHASVVDNVNRLTEIIDNPEKISEIMRNELLDIKKTYGCSRKTEIGHGLSDVTREDMIPKEDIVMLITKNGYVKRMPISSMSAQNRGTRGKRFIEISDGDEVTAIYQGNTHDLIMIFDNEGQVYSCKGYKIPEAGQNSKGRHIKNVIEGFDKEIAAIARIPVELYDKASLLIVTSNGTVKRSSLDVYSNADRKGGVRGITLDEGNQIVNVFVALDGQQALLISNGGKAIRFDLDEVREIGRTGQGVRGMKLDDGERIVGAHVVNPDSQDHIVCIGSKGVGKRTLISEFNPQGRAGSGVIAFKITEKTGELVAAFGADESRDIVMLATNGVSNRIAVQDIRETGRAASGVILMNLDEGHCIASVTTVVRMNESEEE